MLAARLVDSNTKIAVSALALCQSMAAAMGPECGKHVRTFFPSFLQGMGDSKVGNKPVNKSTPTVILKSYCLYSVKYDVGNYIYKRIRKIKLYSALSSQSKSSDQL